MKEAKTRESERERKADRARQRQPKTIINLLYIVVLENLPQKCL